ncbi:MAG: phage terminase large subunit [Anaerolineales bacterium]|nr:phage terminase large subunit [Anaerolineales bacterium]
MLSSLAPATISPRQASVEKDLRKEARRNFLAYCQYVDPRYETPPHIQLLAAKLQQVALYIASGGKRGIPRLMIFMPPQHGKSQIASRNFPAWLLGILPDSHIILTSYGDSLATRHSRFIRDQITAPEYQAIFGTKSNKMMPVELSSDSRSTENWDLARPYRGGVKAAGVGGGITGLPAHLFIIDDPLKNREEAESESRRDLVDDWFKSAARTRLRPNAAVVIFHTRWHPDDLAGRLMRRMISDPLASQWEIVCMPGLALDSYPATVEEQRKRMRDGVYLPMADPLGRKPGEALCPGWYNTDFLLSTRADLGVYDFEALYQQSPFAKDGQKYKREWFKTIAKLPEGVTILYIIRYWDKANSTKGDFTVGVLMAYGSDGYFYILDVARGQWSSYERDQKMRKVTEEDAKAYGKVYVWHQQDPGSAGKDSAEATNRVLMGFPAKFEPLTGDKETRSEPLESAFQGGMIYLMQAAWNEVFIDEYAAFPRGKYDDQVDAGSSAYNKLLETIRNKRKSRVM